MNSRNFGGSIIVSSIITTIVVLLIFIVLQWLQMPVGHFMDWLVGITSFWWLIIIVTVPWNIHFEARAVLDEAAQSEEANIPIKPEKVVYVKMVAQRSLWLAIGLHGLSAIGLYTLAAMGISAVGYVGSGMALLLTILRPSIRAYEYVAELLSKIRREFKYPREDVIALRHRFDELKEKVEVLETQLNPKESNTWAAQLQQTQKNLEQLTETFKEHMSINQTEHKGLMSKFQQELSQVATDGELLRHVRELIRFFKEA